MALEVCADGIASAAAALAGGAERVELCSSLGEGGLTPSIGLIERVVALYAEHEDAPRVHVLVRCRGGNFCFSDEEVEVMCADVRAAKRAGAHGVVVGCLTPGLSIDCGATGRLLRLGHELGLRTTLHRCIDMCPDVVEALREVLRGEMQSDVDYVLTSGGAATALEGVDALRRMVEVAAAAVRESESEGESAAAVRVTVVGAAGVSEANARAIIDATGLTQLHGSLRSAVRGSGAGAFAFAAPGDSGGDAERLVSDAARIAAAGAALRAAPPALAANARASELRAAFLEHGFIVIRGFMSAVDVAACRAALSELIGAMRSGGAKDGVGADAMYDDAARFDTLKQIQHLDAHSEHFAKLMTHRMRPLCAVLLGEDAVAQNMQFFNKPPRRHYADGDSSKSTPPHQDGFYFMLDPRDAHLACTMWLALDDATRENGCLRYTLGSAQRGMRSHDYSGIMGFSQRIDDYSHWDRSREVAIEVAPGDLVIHSALMIHRAERNETADMTRRAVGAICFGISARRDEAAHAAKARAIRERAAYIVGQTAASVGLSADR